jgi:hypothetical protein
MVSSAPGWLREGIFVLASRSSGNRSWFGCADQPAALSYQPPHILQDQLACVGTLVIHDIPANLLRLMASPGHERTTSLGRYSGARSTTSRPTVHDMPNAQSRTPFARWPNCRYSNGGPHSFT